MTARALAASTADYEQTVATKLRGCLAEKRLTKHDLAQRLGRTDFWVGRRANGQTPITVGELIEITEALGEPLARFLPEDIARAEFANAVAASAGIPATGRVEFTQAVAANLAGAGTRSSTDRASDYGSSTGRERTPFRAPRRRRRSDLPGRHETVVLPILRAM